METLIDSRKQSWLSWFYRGFLILGFLLLLGRVIDLQIIRGDYFRNLAEGNRIRRVPIVASRGEILARGGEIIVGNKDIDYHLIFDPMEGYQKGEVTNETPLDEIISEPMRKYQGGNAFAHLSGYLGKVDAEESGKVNAGCQEKGARAHDALVGRTGLEEFYECTLTGINGEELVEVDSFGDRIRSLGRRPPVSGDDIKTTIHFGLQNYISEIMDGSRDFDRGDIPEGEQKGAVVVSDIHGEILALYSSPSYNPNSFIEGDSAEITDLFSRSDLPLFNRAIAGTYHPGSVFKPFVGIAALESGAIDPDYTYIDTGVLTVQTNIGVFTYSNWYFTQYGGVEGEVDLVRSLARSTDTFFYKVGELTGMDELTKWMEDFGLGLPTQIDLPGEVSGLIPNPEWKKLAKGERWFLGNTYHFAIGQNDIVLTPLQINTSISALAARGNLCIPHLLQGDANCRKLEISPESLDLVIQGMQEACTLGATAFTFFEVNDIDNEKYENRRVACKTGTAEVGTGDSTHAWFTFFTPSTMSNSSSTDSPEIVVTVLIEKGGEGSKIAGPIARAIYDYWYGDLLEESFLDE